MEKSNFEELESQLKTAREELLGIDEEKAKMEEEMMAITESLTSEGMPGLKGNLVDEDGFPRADIDVVEIRRLRNRLACLQTDHKEIFNRMSEKLEKFHVIQRKVNELKYGDAEGKEERKEIKKKNEETNGIVEAVEPIKEKTKTIDAVPFLWVGEVSSGSPAETAGLKTGDAIVQFDKITYKNEEGLKEVAELLNYSEGFTLKISVIRKIRSKMEDDMEVDNEESNSLIELKLIPKKWEGRGLLGCFISKNPI